MSLSSKVAIALLLPLISTSSLASQDSRPLPSPLKHEIGTDACKSGVIMHPNNLFGVFVFCDDAMGTNIGIVSVGRGGENAAQIGNNWPLEKRFWQENAWTRDVKYFEWAPDGKSLTVRTNYVYGTNKLYKLDLINKKIISAVDQPIED